MFPVRRYLQRTQKKDQSGVRRGAGRRREVLDIHGQRRGHLMTTGHVMCLARFGDRSPRLLFLVFAVYSYLQLGAVGSLLILMRQLLPVLISVLSGLKLH